MDAVNPIVQTEDVSLAAADEQLLAAIREREGSAFGNEADPASTDRATAIDYYLGQPFGNEIEGRSQVVSRDVADTIEWIKPALIRIFTGGDRVVRFDPQGEEDVEASEQESDYVDYIVQRKNNWFQIAYEWFTDALLTRNAYAMAYWEDKQEAVIERYNGLTTNQLTLIGMDPTVQIIAHRSYSSPIAVPGMGMDPMAAAVQQALIPLHDVEIRRAKNYGCAKICVLPPERCLVAQDSRGVSVRDSSFFEYWEYKTLSQLRIDGFDVPDDIADSTGVERGVVDQARDISAQTILAENEQFSDPSMRKVRVRMVWIRNDYDGDGIAEIRYVVAVGDTLLVNQEVSGIPVACIVPTPMPHRHIGLSVFDWIKDLQLIKSAMMRQVIDNQYLANNGRLGADKNKVNLDDALISRPGGLIRTDGPPGESLMPIVHPQTALAGIEVLNYLDAIRQDRGGVSKPYAGADLTSVQAQPNTLAQLTSQASQKIELIARVFSEGVKELFLIVHEITLSNATVQDKVQLRGKWTTVDPRGWKKRSDMTLTVGLGVGNRQQQLVALQMILGYQEKAAPYGLSTPKKVYNTLAELTKAAGFASAEHFWQEPPEEATFPQSKPVQVQVAEIKAQADLLVQDLKNQGTQLLTQFKEEAAAARSFFETAVDANNQAQERYLRAISEQTERMQELRLVKEEKKTEKAEA